MMEGDCEVLDWLRYYLSLNSLPPSIIITVVAACGDKFPHDCGAFHEVSKAPNSFNQSFFD